MITEEQMLDFSIHFNREDPNDKIKRLMEEIGWDKLSDEELKKAISEQLEVMVKLGQVEQLVGEDGEFYYKSTGLFPFGMTEDE